MGGGYSHPTPPPFPTPMLIMANWCCPCSRIVHEQLVSRTLVTCIKSFR